MKTTTIIDNENVTVWHHEDLNIIHHSFKRTVKGTQLRDALTKGAETMEAHKCTKWLSDDRGNTALPEDDEKWAKSIWFPRVCRAGWKHWALVLPVKAVGQLNVQHFAETYAQFGINAKFFTDPDEAMSWLQAQ